MKQQGSLLRKFPNNLKGPKFEGCLTVLDSILASYLNRLDSGTLSSLEGVTLCREFFHAMESWRRQGQMCQRRTLWVEHYAPENRLWSWRLLKTCAVIRSLSPRRSASLSFPTMTDILTSGDEIRNSVTDDFQLMLFVSLQRLILAKLKKQFILNISYHFRFAISERMMVDSSSVERWLFMPYVISNIPQCKMIPQFVLQPLIFRLSDPKCLFQLSSCLCIEAFQNDLLGMNPLCPFTLISLPFWLFSNQSYFKGNLFCF